VIRHIVMVEYRGPVPPEQLEEIRSALVALPAPGRVAFSMGVDLGLRDGNMDLAIVADFEDEPAYQAYDADEAHDRIRREMIAPIAERFERCQFVL